MKIKILRDRLVIDDQWVSSEMDAQYYFRNLPRDISKYVKNYTDDYIFNHICDLSSEHAVRYDPKIDHTEKIGCCCACGKKLPDKVKKFGITFWKLKL